MTGGARPDDDRALTLAPLDEKVDHVRGSPAGRLIIEYGDYECPYSRQAFHAIEEVEQQPGGNVRFAFRHFPLTSIQPRERHWSWFAGPRPQRCGKRSVPMSSCANSAWRTSDSW